MQNTFICCYKLRSAVQEVPRSVVQAENISLILLEFKIDF